MKKRPRIATDAHGSDEGVSIRENPWLSVAKFVRRLKRISTRGRQDRALREEMQAHLEMKIEDNVAAGMGPVEARQAALREFGNATLLREESHDTWRWATWDSLAQDARYSLRTLRRAPAFTAAAVITLAFGIGATTAMFSLLQAVVLRAVPFAPAKRLFVVHEFELRSPGEPFEVANPNYLLLRERLKSFDSLAAWMSDTATVRTAGPPELAARAMVSANLLATLGVQAELGRGFAPEEGRAGGPPVAMISERMWREKFGADSAILSRTLTINDNGAQKAYAIVGVLGRDAQFPSAATDIWTPLEELQQQDFMRRRSAHVLGVVGRLRPGVSPQAAGNELQREAARLQREFPGEDPEHGMSVRSLQDEVVGSSRLPLTVLFGSAMLLLLIACLNVANLAMVRLASRRREMGLRVALGASRIRVARQVLTENLLLAILGGGIGVAAVPVLLRAARAPLSAVLPRPANFSLNGEVLAFAASATLLAGIALAAVALLQGARLNLERGVEEARGAGVRSSSRAATIYVGAQVAVTLVLLAGFGLMLNSLRRVLEVQAGFRADNLLTLAVTLPSDQYHARAQEMEFYRDAIARLAQLPGASEAAAVSSLPLSGADSKGDLTIEGRTFAAGEVPAASYLRSMPGYFHAMGIPLVMGRDFNAQDDGRQMVTVISESMARRFWAGQNPIGARIKIGDAKSEPWLTVVGVVGDVHSSGLELDPPLASYEPMAQRPRLTMRMIVRTSVPPRSLAAAAEKSLRELQKDVVVFDSAAMEERIAVSVLPRRLQVFLLGGFALGALLLAAVGIYGLVAYAVVLRTREIGIRMALGSGRGAVLRMVLGDSLRLFAAGACVGLAGALLAARAASRLLFGVRAYDPATFAVVLLVLAIAVLLASALPARRALSIDPMVALRYE